MRQTSYTDKAPRRSDDLANGITMQQELFARHVVAGLSVESAYRAAFRISDSDDPVKVAGVANRLCKSPRVAVRIAALRDASDKEAVAVLALSRSYVIEGLLEVHRAAMETANLPSATRALELLGKVTSIGLFEDVVRDVSERFVIGAAPTEGEAPENADIESWARAHSGVAAEPRPAARAAKLPR